MLLLAGGGVPWDGYHPLTCKSDHVTIQEHSCSYASCSNNHHACSYTSRSNNRHAAMRLVNNSCHAAMRLVATVAMQLCTSYQQSPCSYAYCSHNRHATMYLAVNRNSTPDQTPCSANAIKPFVLSSENARNSRDEYSLSLLPLLQDLRRFYTSVLSAAANAIADKHPLQNWRELYNIGGTDSNRYEDDKA